MSEDVTISRAVEDGENRPVTIGLIGNGIARSRTPGMHLAAARAMGLAYDYRLFDTNDPKLPQSAAKLLDLAERQGFSGLNVTHPFKRDVVPLMDALSEAASRVGAVNTVVFRDGKRFGHNTDHWGFRQSLEVGLPAVKRDSVLLLGAGGAGGAVAHALLDAGVGQLLVHDRDAPSSDALATRLRNSYGSDRATIAPDPEASTGVDGIVNATPVGMAAHPGTPLPVALLRPDHWVADIVYFPLETELLKAARALGCAVLPGSGMALYQAVRAFELFTGKTPDTDRMREAFDAFD